MLAIINRCTIRKKVKELDPKAFTVIMESNEVVGEGFKDNGIYKRSGVR